MGGAFPWEHMIRFTSASAVANLKDHKGSVWMAWIETSPLPTSSAAISHHDGMASRLPEDKHKSICIYRYTFKKRKAQPTARTKEMLNEEGTCF